MLDLAPLTTPLTSAQSAEIEQRAKRGEFGPSTSMSIGQVMALVLFVLVALPMLANFLRLAFGMWSVSSGIPGSGRSPFMVMPVLMAVFAVLLIGLGGYRLLRGLGTGGDWRQLAHFATSNGLNFRRRSANPSYPGLLFGVGSSRCAIDHVWSANGELADAGRYTYTTGSDDNETTHHWTYAAFRLPRNLPHLVLDNRGNNGFGSNLPARFARGQKLSLGGVFDQQWTLYAPSGYGADTYQIFTPDVMEALVSGQYTFDIEIVDDWLFLYSKKGSLLDPAFWQQLEHVRQMLVARIARGSYVDRRPELDHAAGVSQTLLGQPVHGRLPEPGPGQAMPPVAPQGRRLRTSWARGVVVFVAAVVFGFVFVHLFPLFAMHLMGR